MDYLCITGPMAGSYRAIHRYTFATTDGRPVVVWHGDGLPHLFVEEDEGWGGGPGIYDEDRDMILAEYARRRSDV